MIKTKRLFIRSLSSEDWQSMKRIFDDFEKSPYAAYDMPFPKEEREIKALTETFAYTQLFFTVMLDSVMIGYVCFHEENESFDLGFCFHSDYHGKGYALESCSALIDYMAGERAAKIFTAGTALKNTPSCKLLERLGFSLKDTETLSFRKDGNGNAISFEGGIYRKET